MFFIPKTPVAFLEDKKPNPIIPNYAKCLDVINSTPYVILANVTYSDATDAHLSREKRIEAYQEMRFNKADRIKAGDTFTTSIPVKSLHVKGEGEGLQSVEHEIVVTGVQECVERTVYIDDKKRFYVVGKYEVPTNENQYV